jgi:aspartate aminotransferase
VRLSRRVQEMLPSATLEVKQVAERLRDQGVDVIDFGPGEPDFNTPDNIKAAGRKAIEDNLSHYLPPLGLRSLRRAIIDSYARRYGSDYGENEAIVGCGAKGVLFAACLAMLSDGDEAIIPAPYWVSFPEQVKLASGRPLILETFEKEGFVPRASDAERLVTARTRAIILCSPSNPTGSVIPQEEVDRFVELARERDLYLVFDETYEHFVYDGVRHGTPAWRWREIRDRLLLVNSVSKAFAMTGWRVGYALGPRPLITAMASIQGHDATHATGVAQAAATEALVGAQDSMRRMLQEYGRRRRVIVDGLRRLKGVSCLEPPGAFYAFPCFTGLYERFGVDNTVDLSTRLLEEAAVATVPGEAFGAPGYLRFSYALALEKIHEGMNRLRRCVG